MMKVKNVHIQNFKRFTDLIIERIPETAKMIVLVGPNECGKISVFEVFNAYLFANWMYIDNEKMNIKQFMRSYAKNYSGNCLIERKYFSKHVGCKEDIDINVYNADLLVNLSEKSIYFGTAYRNQDNSEVKSLSFNEIGKRDPILFISNDEKVSINYMKLVSRTLTSIYDETNSDKIVKALKDELIGKIQQSIENIFGDLILKNIQSPLKEGSFYFKKGIVENYHHKNLSGGEKAVFDLLLDLIVNLDDYQDSLFFIDEPEAYIHTELQGQVIEEIYHLIPGNSQLWITTHSFGIMTKAKELSIQHPGSVVFLDFDGHDFDQSVTIQPLSINSTVWKKFMSVALDGMEKQFVSKITIMCERGSNDHKKTMGEARESEENNDFDSVIYNKIFKDGYSSFVTFESVGSCNNLERDIIFGVMSKMLKEQTQIYRLRDKNDATP